MENYKKLISLINQYKETEFWKYISGDDFFKIKDNKDIFVSIMGQEGLDKSIAIYNGKDELMSQLDIAFFDYSNSPDSYNRLSCYKICIDDPGNLLMANDKKILKNNKLSNKIVVLRLESGKLPRLVTEEESLFVLEILNKIILIAEYYIANKMTEPSDKVLEKMYVFDVLEQKVICKKTNFPKLTYVKEKTTKINDDLVNKILIFKQKGDYEVSLMYSPFYVEETKEYSYMLVIKDMNSGLVLNCSLLELKERKNIPNKVLDIFEKYKIYPKNIMFNAHDVLYLCTDLIKNLKINFGVNPNNGSLFELWINLYNGVGR